MRSPAQSLALAGASQASEALAELIRFAREGGDLDCETVEKLLDAAKLAIEVETGADDVNGDMGDRGQVYGAIVRHLEGWAG